jgi:hypothetical protein
VELLRFLESATDHNRASDQARAAEADRPNAVPDAAPPEIDGAPVTVTPPEIPSAPEIDV